MYIPKHYKEEDMVHLVAFMNQYPFALLISQVDGKPFATHLPFIIEKNQNGILLQSHMALANPQWKQLAGQQVLIVFSEPHAYISPSLYEKKENVPTWNYIAVHAYGHTTLIENKDKVEQLLHKTISTFEPAYVAQYKDLNSDYLRRMVKGIKAFSIEVNDVQGKFKLSQNKTIVEQKNIVDHLQKQNENTSVAIAQYMKNKLPE
ncbi:MAG TPA: FMN-binding negative transcriptional regulator [Bacteroidia bacterium]|nr:FMN-binding negative transcriptional regulator [Bacteroidia bacterium]